LLYALNHCPKSAQRNVQLILTSLIPVNMLLGVMPAEQLGRQYNVTEYIQLGQAVVRGDLRTFEEVGVIN
jgi:nuclear mRNA export protein PCID2/THP1